MRIAASAVLSLALAACATPPPGGLASVVTGPTRICLDRAAFTLPEGGTIVQAEQGSVGTHLVGRIGFDAFEITESGSFAAIPVDGSPIYQGNGFAVRRVGDSMSSFAVYLGDGTEPGARPITRIEHFFGTDSVTVEEFFGSFDPAGAAQGPCDRRF